MQRLIIAVTMCAGAGVANASSIEPYSPTASSRTSIVEIGCPSCTRAAAEKAAKEAEVRLAPGELIVEVHEVDGQMMIHRTENLLGGSPVTMVRKASKADLIALGYGEPEPSKIAETDAPTIKSDTEPMTADAASEPKLFEPVIANSAPGVDEETKTSALEDTSKAEFDPSKFELRLN